MLSEVGEIYFRNGRSSLALQYFNQALQADPEHHASHRFFADYYAKMGNDEEFRKHIPYLIPSGSGSTPR
jgi:Tfp pilus assembly protein PilF